MQLEMEANDSSGEDEKTVVLLDPENCLLAQNLEVTFYTFGYDFGAPDLTSATLRYDIMTSYLPLTI